MKRYLFQAIATGLPAKSALMTENREGKAKLFPPNYLIYRIIFAPLKKWTYILCLLALLIISGYMFFQYYKPFGQPPKLEEVQRSSAFQDGAFRNDEKTDMHMGISGIWKILKRYWSRNVEANPSGSYIFSEGNGEILKNGSVHVNWLGHAAVLIHHNGKYVLTDPALTSRASPFSFTGPERFFASPIPLEKMPPLEAVIISHDHYDHFDYGSIKALSEKTNMFYVPIGLGASLEGWGIPREKITEADWWEPFEFNGIRITATPARHFSGRLFKRNNTLWASWTIEVGGKKLYFGGDSGYFKGYKKIGLEKGPFDMSFMPIGAYDDMWAEIHLNPEEAVQAHLDLHGGYLCPIHWGTFDMALHSWSEPMERLSGEAARQGVQLAAPVPGAWMDVENPQTDPGWWKRFSKK